MTEKKARSSRFVWVVIHCEWAGTIESFTMDEMVFHVSSTRRAAEKYVLRLWTTPHSWWKVQRYRVDCQDIDEDDRPLTHYFRHTGKPVKSPPHAWALRQFKRKCETDARRMRETSLP